MSAIVLNLYGTSIGKKVVMAMTGLVMFAWLCVHMIGNLQLFAGPAKLNAYAHFLQTTPSLLWTSRTVTLFCVVLHVLTGVLLTLQNWRGRPVRYTEFQPVESSLLSRNMIWTGLILALFVTYHLLHLTIGLRSLHPQFDPVNVHANVVIGFSHIGTAAFYVICMAVLGLHMGHGVFSLFQSLGLAHPKYNHWRRRFATAVTLLIVAGNVSMPAAVVITNVLAANHAADTSRPAPATK
jgi:succinate dehydrogenase / fumarate reductase, cytochrome b subunit